MPDDKLTLEQLLRISRVSQEDTTSEVNALLEEGWVLLGVASGVNDRGEPQHLFAMGRPTRDPLGRGQ